MAETAYPLIISWPLCSQTSTIYSIRKGKRMIIRKHRNVLEIILAATCLKPWDDAGSGDTTWMTQACSIEAVRAIIMVIFHLQVLTLWFLSAFPVPTLKVWSHHFLHESLKTFQGPLSLLTLHTALILSLPSRIFITSSCQCSKKWQKFPAACRTEPEEVL